MSTAGGWHGDPYGRADQRWWDGERWTEHVVRNDVPGVDPVGPDQPQGAQRFLESLGPDAKERPEPDIFNALSAAGAALVAVGVLILAAGDDFRTGVVLVVAALLVAAGYGLALIPKRTLRPAAVTVAAIGISVFVFVAFKDTVADGKLAAPLIVLAVATAVMWVEPILHARPFLLGISLASLVGAIAFAVAQGGIDVNASDTSSSANSILGTASERAYAVFLIAGVVLLFIALLLDHAEYRGIATVFVAVGIVAVLTGATGVAQQFDDLVGSILVGLAGLALAIVGTMGGRRFTTWLGAVVVAFALAGVVAAIVSSNDNTKTGILLAVFGIVTVAVCAWLPMVWRARAVPRTPLPPPPPSD